MSSESENEGSSADEDYVPSGGEQSEDDDLKHAGKDDEGGELEESGSSKEEVDKIWNEFKADVNKPKKVEGASSSKNEKIYSKESGEEDEERLPVKKSVENKQTITVTKIYDFAGEEVKVTKEVDKNSKEALSHLKKRDITATKTSGALSRSKRPGGGLQGLLGKMGKKPKMSTLEKSKLDWQSYKEQEGIQDELKNFNKGKEGYLEKQSFLERTDHRQFEKEKELRLGKR